MAYTAGQILRASQLGPVPCTSATRPASPHSGQLIVESDTGMVAIYSGSAWRYLAPTGEVSTHGEWNVTGTQSLSNGSNTILSFATESTSTPLVTRAVSGTGHQFTLNRAGHWAITLNAGTASATGERTASINDTVGAVASQNVLNAGVCHNNVVLIRNFPSGTVLTMKMFQSTGGAINTLAGTGETRLHIAWIHS